MKKDISKTIVFVFSNKFTKQLILSVFMPYLPFLATNGHYSKLYNKLKTSAATNMEKSLVKGRKYFTSNKSTRMIIELPSGLSLDMPHDVTRKDIAIIKHHLEGVKMAIAQ